MDQFAVVTARMPQYVQQERFDAGSMEVHLFDTKDDATEWAILNPNYITEVVPVTKHDEEPDPDRFGSDDPARPTSSCSCGFELVWGNGAWVHDAPAFLWGDDHDANATEPDPEDPARKYWDIEDGIVEEITDERDVANAEINRITAERKRNEGSWMSREEPTEDEQNEERGDICSALRDLGYEVTADEVGGMIIEDARVTFRMMAGVEWNWEGQQDKWQAQAMHEAEALEPEFDPDHTYDPYGGTKHRVYEEN